MGWNDWIRTVEIAPSLTAADPAAVMGQVETLLRAGCRVFHIDDDLDLLERIAPVVHRYDGIVDVRLADAESVASAVALGADSVTVTAVTPNVVARGEGGRMSARRHLRHGGGAGCRPGFDRRG